MNIILIANNSERARKLALTRTNIILAMAVFSVIIITLALVLNFVSLRYADRIDAPSRFVNQEERHQAQMHLQDNLNIMASKLINASAVIDWMRGRTLMESTGFKARFIIQNIPRRRTGMLCPKS